MMSLKLQAKVKNQGLLCTPGDQTNQQVRATKRDVTVNPKII